MPNDTAPAAAGQDFSAPRGARTEGRLEFSRGAAHLAIRGASMEDLFGAHFDQPVPSVAVDGGTVTVQYPRFSPRGWLRPAGVVPVRIRGGASQVRIRRPAGVPVQLRVGRGVADLRFDEQEWGAVGGGLRLVTPEATQVPDRYEIEIASGATHLEISAEEGSNRP